MQRALLVLALLSAAVSGACGSSHHAASTPAGCRAPFQERLDPRSTQHLFPGASEPTYLSDPPTSGPHKLGPPPTGAVSTAISRPVQVAMLEAGFVIIQYRPSNGPSGGPPAGLTALAGDRVTVAPGPPTPPLPSPVVATAWTWKLECGLPPSLAGLRAFIAAHKGKGFAHS